MATCTAGERAIMAPLLALLDPVAEAPLALAA
jgi:hypothetical protein